MINFKPSKLTLAMLSTGLMAFGSHAFAAEDVEEETKASEEEENVITVTGIRGSLMRSQAEKRYSTNIVDAISAEDIGKLPDSSIAESLARIPGLAAQRLEGRASQIAIRGFGENESTTTFNGREQVSIGDGRGVEFDLYPSEIMSGVNVYKTPDASMSGEGIAGVIDMRTVSPLSKQERVILVNGQFEMNGHDAVIPGYDDTGHRLTVSYIDQFADDTVGVAISVNTMSSPGQEKQFGRHGDPYIYNHDASVFPQTAGLDFVKGINLKGRSSLLERDSLLAVVEFAPSDDLKITVDTLQVDFSDERYIGAVEMGFNNCDWITNCGITVHNDVNGFVTDATYHNMPFYVKNNQEHRNADLSNFGVNVEYSVNEDFSLEFDASSSKVERDLYQHATFGGAADFAGNDISYSLTPDGAGGTFSSTLNYADPSVVGIGDIMSWGLAGERSNPKVEDEIKSFKLAAELVLDSDVIESLEFGVSFRERSKQKTISYTKTDILPGALIPGTNIAAIPAEYLLGTVDLSHAGFGHSIIFDQEALLASGNFYSETDVTYSWGKINDAFQITEEVTSAFVQANFNTEFNGTTVRGNFGLRYIETDQSSLGDIFGWSGIDTQTVFNHSYSNILPSANIIIDISEDKILRLGLAKTIARPIMDDMKGGLLVEPTSWSGNPADTDQFGNYWKASGGNYKLEAREANGLDVSFEDYFSSDGYYSIAYFYKEIKNWNFDNTYISDLQLDSTAMATHPVAQPWGGNDPSFNSQTSTFYTKENGGEGTLHGLELSISLPLHLISESLEGFGVFASHTVVDQKMVDFDNRPYTLPGLSENVSTLTAYYEKDGLQIRTSMRKRSDFTASIYSTIGLSTEERFGLGETLVDAQVGYDFNENLYIFVQGQNLTNEPFVTKFENADYATDQFFDYGRSFQLGFSYKL